MRRGLLLVATAALAMTGAAGCGDPGCGQVGCAYTTLIHVQRTNGQPFVLGSIVTFRIETSTSMVESTCTVQRPIQCRQTGSGNFELFEMAARPPTGTNPEVQEIALRWEDGAHPGRATLTVTIGAATAMKDFAAPQPAPQKNSCEACGAHPDVDARMAL